MWRTLQNLPRIWKWNGPCWSTVQNVNSEDGVESAKSVVNVVCHRRFHTCGHKRPAESSSHEGKLQGYSDAGSDWYNWQRSFRHNYWYRCGPFHVLEAIGWGTLVVLSLQLSSFWRQQRCYPSIDGARRCMFYRVASSVRDPGSPGKVRAKNASEKKRQLEKELSSFNLAWLFGQYESSTAEKINGKELSSDENQFDFSQSATDPRFYFSDESNYGESNDDKQSEASVVQKVLTAQAIERARTDVVDDFRCTDLVYHNLRENARGVARMKEGRCEEAVKLWRSLRHSVEAIFNLGLSYETGQGVPVDMQQAVRYYQEAADKGHARAQFNLAMLQLTGQGGLVPDANLALHWLEQAAQQGLKQAQTEAGVLYTEPEHRDMNRAVGWFEKAAEQKDPRGLYFLGICYENGWGVEVNAPRAAELYSQAAKLGNHEAQFNLAVFFENGLAGLPMDKKTALELYQQAAQGGCQDALTGALRIARQRAALDQDLQIEDTRPSSGLRPSASTPALRESLQHLLVDLTRGKLGKATSSSPNLLPLHAEESEEPADTRVEKWFDEGGYGSGVKALKVMAF